VLSPALLRAASMPAQSKPSATIVGATGALGVSAMTKLYDAPGAILKMPSNECGPGQMIERP
jgi:hypothetical protein